MFFSLTIRVLVFFYQYFAGLAFGERELITKPRAYYISFSGNDKNDGTRGAPFQSIQRINKIPLKPGDSILFEGNRQFSGSLTISLNGKGDPQHILFISSYGTGHASIYSGNNPGIHIENLKWIEIRKLKITGAGRKKGNVQNGIIIRNSSHIIADSLEISGFQKSGLLIDYSNNIFISHIFTHENGFAGISVGGSGGSKKTNHHIYIRHCRAENNPGDPSNLDNHSGNGIVVSSCTLVLIEYSTATHNGWDMPRKGNGPVGIWAYEADSVIIQHCLSYRNKTSAGGGDGGGFDLDGGVTNSSVQYCLSYENQGAGYGLFQYPNASPWHDNVFRYNISENDGSISDAHAAVYIWNGSGEVNQFYNALFYNNTVYNAKGAAISYSNQSARKGFAFYNNIFVSRDSLVHGKSGDDIFLGNDWWSLKTGGGATGLGGLKVDPGFMQAGKSTVISASGLKNFRNYRLPGNSPLHKSGTNLKKSYGIQTGNKDFNGAKTLDNLVGACF